jgi:DNA-binding response OmpR family regulator
MPPAARILVVDDEPALGALLVRVLQEEGYAAIATTDGRVVWATALAAGEPFDLLVTNRFLPELPAMDVLALLEREYPGAPILHLDSLASPRHHGVPHEAAYHPFSRDLFVAEVKRLLAAARHRQST